MLVASVKLVGPQVRTLPQSVKVGVIEFGLNRYKIGVFNKLKFDHLLKKRKTKRCSVLVTICSVTYIIAHRKTNTIKVTNIVSILHCTLIIDN